MSIFRKSHKKNVYPAGLLHDIPVVKRDTLEDGTIVESIVMVSPSEFEKSVNLPKESDYKLKDLLAAGVDLKEISTAGLLDSSDFFEQEINKEQISDSILSKLKEFESSRNQSIDNYNKSEKPNE